MSHVAAGFKELPNSDLLRQYVAEIGEEAVLLAGFVFQGMFEAE